MNITLYTYAVIKRISLLVAIFFFFLKKRDGKGAPLGVWGAGGFIKETLKNPTFRGGGGIVTDCE